MVDVAPRGHEVTIVKKGATAFGEKVRTVRRDVDGAREIDDCVFELAAFDQTGATVPERPW
jgi:hypothetical protein